YTSILFTHERQIAERPEVVRKMVAASRRGWARYLEAPEKANAAIHKLNPEMDLDILEYGAETLRPLVLDSDSQRHGIGTMSRQRWQTLEEQLVASGQLKPGTVRVDAAFTDR